MSSNNGRNAGQRSLPRAMLLDALTEGQRRTVQESCRTLEVRRRKRVYMPGDPSDHVFLIRSGIVKLGVLSAEGRELILSFLHPGDVFGELAVVDDSPRDHVAEAYEDAVIHAIGRDVFQGLLRESPRLGHEITKLLGSRLRTYRIRVEELLFKSAHARVAHTLLDLAGQHGVQDAQGVVIPLRLSQRDIGNLVGLTRETVNSILKDLRQRNLIETEGRSIRLKAPEVLHAAG